MAAKLAGGPIAITTTAQSFTTGLGLAVRQSFSTYALRADLANTATIWIGRSNVTTTTNQMGYLRPGDAMTIDLVGKFIHTDDVYVVGANGDKLYVMDIG